MTIVSTVGYENTFDNFYAKLIILVIIIFAGYKIIPATSEIIMILSGKSAYSRLSYSLVDKIYHIIITGSVTRDALEDFLEEFFHEDHGNAPKHCVILGVNRPDSDLESVIRKPKYDKKVFFIQGNPLDEQSLIRAQAGSSRAIVVMANKYANEPDEEDSRTILIAIFIKKYLKGLKVNSRLCMQL